MLLLCFVNFSWECKLSGSIPCLPEVGPEPICWMLLCHLASSVVVGVRAQCNPLVQFHNNGFHDEGDVALLTSKRIFESAFLFPLFFF